LIRHSKSRLAESCYKSVKKRERVVSEMCVDENQTENMAAPRAVLIR
jgi:hypothetical protein